MVKYPFKQFKRIYENIENDSVDTFLDALEQPLDKFIETFKDIYKEPRVHALITAGLVDGKPADEVTTFQTISMDVTSLYPTQEEIGFEESLKNILKENPKYKNLDKGGSLDNILQGNNVVIGAPIVIFNKQYIIDGHHRWSQIYVANPGATVKCININIPKMSPEDMLKVIQIAIVADIGKLPSISALGENLLNASQQNVIDYVIKNTDDKALDLYYNYNYISTKDRGELGDYIWSNVSMLQSKNAPIPGAVSRIYMPQTDNSKNWTNLLQQGIINYLNPNKQDVENAVNNK